MTLENMKTTSTEFETIKGIPYVIEAIEDSHIPIVAPGKDAPEYYCRKGFYSVILQGVVMHNANFGILTLNGQEVVMISQPSKEIN